jgi:hypothetical protein
MKFNMRNLIMQTTTFENAKIGDKVYSPTFGWGEIEFIDMDATNYPICVLFLHDNTSTGYTLEGYHYHDLQIQSLFWNKVDIEAPVKPVATKTINGFDIPDISFIPDVGESCYIPSPTLPELFAHHVYRAYRDGIVANKHLSNNGLCYPLTEEGRKAAILHAKAMLRISQ